MTSAKRKQTMGAAPEKRLEKRPVADLKPFYRQDVMYHPLTQEELERMAEVARRESIPPFEILPNGTIIDGHQRRLIARMLGIEYVECWVRYDIADDVFAVARRDIETNRERCQLDQPDQVRLAVSAFEIDRKRKPGQLLEFERRELKKFVADRIGMTPRHTQRLLNVIAAPMEVQRAYSKGLLKIDLAEKVHRLGNDVQTEIASGIRAGGEPTAIVQHPKEWPV